MNGLVMGLYFNFHRQLITDTSLKLYFQNKVDIF